MTTIITNEERAYLMDSMTSLLSKYNYTYTESALDTIIDTWAENKASLIEAFKKHPNYLDGKFMIVFKKGFERAQSASRISAFVEYARNVAYRIELPEEVQAKREFDWFEIPQCIDRLILSFMSYVSANIDDDHAAMFNEILPDLRIRAGQKTSRVMNKLCTYLGIAKDADYNREFAKYADGINPITVNYNVVLSINPLDYLTMSFGNSWSSCHTIDKLNQRRMPHGYNGMYSSGTMSYMLDGTSMVFYFVDAAYHGGEYWNEPKINRQMFHYHNHKLVQARLYPQSNDGDGNIYTPYRNIVQEVVSTIFDFPNLWTNKKGANEVSHYVWSFGTHYKDYTTYNNCNISLAKNQDVEGEIIIGHDPICIECGSEHSTEDNINCCREHGHHCNHCGAYIEYEDDVYWVDDEPYCGDCVTYCERCDEYEVNDNITYIPSEDRYVCNWCRDNYYTWCSECDTYVPCEDAQYVNSIRSYVCDDCLSAYFTECDDCGKYFRNEDMHECDGDFLCERCLEERANEEDGE